MNSRQFSLTPTYNKLTEQLFPPAISDTRRITGNHPTQYKNNADLLSTLSRCRVACLTLDTDQNITSFNEYSKYLLGIAGTTILGTRLDEYLSSESYLFFTEKFSRVLSGESHAELNIVINSGYKNKMTVLALMSASADSDGNKKEVTIALVDTSKQKKKVSELKKAKGYLERLANNDPLTGLANRMRFMEELRGTLLSSRKSNRMVALMYFDLDGFKKINDQFGHHAGDAVLCEIANRLRSRTREEGKLARLGGDEFAMIIEFSGDLTPVKAEALKILDIVKEPIHLQSATVDLMSSIGVCIYPDSAKTPEVLVQQADAAMYEAKKGGGGVVKFFTSDLFYKLARRKKLERTMETGLAQSQFCLNYQPVVSAKTSEIHYYEALLRWRHPEYGKVGPSEFIPLAEGNGEIVKLGYWAIENACRFMQKHSTVKNELKLAINLSPVQFNDNKLIDKIPRIFSKYDISPGNIEFEITESCIFSSSRKSIAAAAALSEIGCSLSIDDFGTGYSSFSRLMKIPATKIKIDRSLIKNITENSGALSIVKGIVGIAHDLGMSVVAEGVETTPQIQTLKETNCNYFQGWAIYAPLAESDLMSSLWDK